MAVEFNFNKLKNVYVATLESLDKALAFDLKVGRGRFLFMMFLSEEDKESKDILFLYMRNTRIMRRIKLYGNHTMGTFKAYINEDVQNCLIQELQLEHTGGNFNFINFLSQINEAIPQETNIADKIKALRDNCNIIRTLNVIDEADKTVLIGERKLSIGTPQDKTLRKLYMYTNSSLEDITELIGLLKKMNMTVAWTTEENRYREADIRIMIENLR
ncbi:hypothetical protein [Clostridium coskatii]|jgi:16S rRNA C1402 N4-methylase RsmH|uniref:Uncharacterized protein n=1 Tax=Clostridium coskatii TaxID=1705578 RepID=A0A166TD91_9CLOT|nr:hypothetical protein [Clostridium coskatii]OAA93539.1 hypothetical protein WX73_04304 [Clostridium coskatii]OBR96328.1 hypothetical protein CLCOS_10410 [Clostridium coskatii]